ncbi:hypothetical protein BJY00DRAFT_276309 [Aspergillus carlsbadensis]|nr:hypothetical protein BJY00DRAFT_276309 [Aspergillus carlsbadensis]
MKEPFLLFSLLPESIIHPDCLSSSAPLAGQPPASSIKVPVPPPTTSSSFRVVYYPSSRLFLFFFHLSTNSPL